MKFQVTTGIVTFRAVEANSPMAAIDAVKARIDRRRYARKDPEVGMSLVHALDAGQLNFLVFDESRRNVLAGEYKGEFTQPAAAELAKAMGKHLTVAHLMQLRR
jgi:hypothetical protein